MEQKRQDTAATAPLGQGVALGVGATCIWGMFPLVFKTVAHIPSLEVLAHRSVWSLVFVTLLMLIMGRRDEIFAKSFYEPKTLLIMAGSGIAIAVNWGIFVWSVANDLVLQSSLGYYINPLVSVALGVVVLRERLTPLAWTAIGFAFAGVAVMIIGLGIVPWVSLGLAVSWAIYGFIRKTAPLGSLPGLYMETLLLSPVALAYIAWLHASGVALFGAAPTDSVLLALTGLATALPLLLFARATRILRLSTIGLLMYIVPTGQFCLAVFVFEEPFTPVHLASFALIWTGLVIYGLSSTRRKKTPPPMGPGPSSGA